MSQLTLGEFTPEPADTTAWWLSDEAAPDDPESCPWCLHPHLTQDLNPTDSWACARCEARIPVDAGWYQRGEKVVL